MTPNENENSSIVAPRKGMLDNKRIQTCRVYSSNAEGSHNDLRCVLLWFLWTLIALKLRHPSALSVFLVGMKTFPIFDKKERLEKRLGGKGIACCRTLFHTNDAYMLRKVNVLWESS